ncbi:MAG: hypothetical protein IPP74_09440 [Alphaproteobacteria bacterium]|nr:hypothetical protein [Alphaproteobacteria bacterium]
MFKQIIMIITTLTLLTGCDARVRAGAPWMQSMLTEGPPGPALFRQGWQDGCETGISATANNFQKMFYDFKQDSKLARDQKYYLGWKLAFDYCQRYTFTYLYTAFINRK